MENAELQLSEAQEVFLERAVALGLKPPAPYELSGAVFVTAARGPVVVSLRSDGDLQLHAYQSNYDNALSRAHEARQLAFDLAFCPHCGTRVVFAHSWCEGRAEQSQIEASVQTFSEVAA